MTYRRRVVPALLALGIAGAGVAVIAPSAQANITKMNCNGSDYWRIYSDSSGEICYAYNGYTSTYIGDVYETTSGNNTGWQRMSAYAGGTVWTSFFDYKDQWKQYNEGDDAVLAVNIN